MQAGPLLAIAPSSTKLNRASRSTQPFRNKWLPLSPTEQGSGQRTRLSQRHSRDSRQPLARVEHPSIWCGRGLIGLRGLAYQQDALGTAAMSTAERRLPPQCS